MKIGKNLLEPLLEYLRVDQRVTIEDLEMCGEIGRCFQDGMLWIVYDKGDYVELFCRDTAILQQVKQGFDEIIRQAMKEQENGVP